MTGFPALRRAARRLPGFRRLAPSLLVIIGRGSTGALPVVVTAWASRAYGIEVMGALATALMLAYATAEIADGFSYRHVPRLVAGRTIADVRPELAEFNGLRGLLLLIGLGLSAAVVQITATGHGVWTFAVLATALGTTMANMHYALALGTDDYTTVGAGPSIALIALAIVGLILAAIAPGLGAWNMALSLSAARLIELAWLRRRQPWPGVTFGRDVLARQWRATRYLVGQTLLSALHVRLVVPLAAFLAGAAAAGVFSIAFSVLAVVSLSAVSLTAPAYRRAVAAGLPGHLAEAWHRTRLDFALGLLGCSGLVVALWVATPWIVSLAFGVREPHVHALVRLILWGGLFESLSLFAALWYHACFRDRDLFVRSSISVIGGWVALIAGHHLAGLTGMAWGFVLTRAGSVLLVYQPVVASRLSTRPSAAPDRVVRSSHDR